MIVIKEEWLIKTKKGGRDGYSSQLYEGMSRSTQLSCNLFKISIPLVHFDLDLLFFVFFNITPPSPLVLKRIVTYLDMQFLISL